ncbi:MAG: formylglycine-generating enzyme family protein [Planctomycetota bacterium]|nr:MAG: formylglycine-generating enzyme family protein [Planctomycetota bacterium]
MFRDRFGLSMEYQLGKVRFRMRWIPPGRFQMGSPKSESGRFDQEGPQHWVVIDRGFWLGETPCTQALWQEVMGDNPSRFQGPERPVEKVSWDDCQKFLKRLEGRLNLQDGLHFSLPLEAEWEYACRAGTTEARYDQDLDSIAWYAANSKKRTHPVGEKKANPWGLFDMLGNVFEWCADGQREYGDRNFDETPSGSMDGPYRVRRGGSWYWRAWNVRAAYRYWSPRAYRYDNLGFRLARGPRALKS